MPIEIMTTITNLSKGGFEPWFAELEMLSSSLFHFIQPYLLSTTLVHTSFLAHFRTKPCKYFLSLSLSLLLSLPLSLTHMGTKYMHDHSHSNTHTCTHKHALELPPRPLSSLHHISVQRLKLSHFFQSLRSGKGPLLLRRCSLQKKKTPSKKMFS